MIMKSNNKKTRKDIKKGLFSMDIILMLDKLYMIKLLGNKKDKRIGNFKIGNRIKLNCINKLHNRNNMIST